MGLTYILTVLLTMAVDNEDSFLDDLLRGEFFGAITGVYTLTLGSVFYVLLFLLGPTLIGIKYQRFAPVAMIMLISGIVFAMFFPTPIQFIFAAGAIFGFAGVLYSVVHK